MIEEYLKKGDLLLDVGTGTGILMIAAAKLGAAKVFGIDKDELALEIARHNLLQNEIDEGRFQLSVGNLLGGVRKRFHIVVANILTEVLVTLSDQIREVMEDSGLFICSGMIEGNTHKVAKNLQRHGFEIVETRTRACWVAMAARQKGQPRSLRQV
jgi:ribosomal protein L11 methyltransferase